MGRLVSAELHGHVKKLLEAGLAFKQITAACGVGSSFIKRIAKTTVRGPCGCGRSVDHGGHCLFRVSTRPAVARARENLWASTKRWPCEADQLLIVGYPAGVPTPELQANLVVRFGLDVTVKSLRQRAADLGVKRPRGLSEPYQTKRPPRLWSEKAVEILADDYPRGVDVDLTVARLKNELGMTVSPSALHRHASRLKLPWNSLQPVTPVEISPPVPQAVKTPFSMLSMRLPDPFKDVRLRQFTEASRGRI